MRHHIHIGRFKTPSLIIDDRQITETLFEAVEQAMKFIVSHISVAFSFDGSLQRIETFAYPLPALREALLNAVVHRDYANPSDIQIKIFDDKITFFSPGNLFGGLKIADLSTDFYQSRLRNKLVAEAFYLTKNIEKYGSGFIRIRKEMEKHPNFSFISEEIGGGVLLTFNFGGVNNQIGGVKGETGGVNNQIGGVKGETGGVNNQIGGVSRNDVGGKSEEASSVFDIFNFIKLNPGSNTSEIVKSLNTPKRTIERLLKKLKDENKIEFKGSPKKGGYFIL